MKQALEAIAFHLKIHFLQPVTTFVRWWLRELALSIPADLRRLFSSRREKNFIQVRGDALHIRRMNGSTESWNTWAVETGNPNLSSTAPALLLPATTVLRRVIELPLVAAASLHETISFQIARITPFEAEQTCHATRLIDRNRKQKTLRVEVAVIPRAVLERTLATVSAHHLRLSAILVEGDVAKPALDFLRYHGEHSTAPRSQNIWRPILAFAIILLLVLPFVATYRLHAVAKGLEAEVKAASKIVQRASTARSQLEILIAAETFLPDRGQGPHAIETLEALARLIPDNTWLFRLELRPNDALLSGFTSDLSTLLQRLAAPPFSSPELTSPVVNGAANNQNRFDLRVQLSTASP